MTRAKSKGLRERFTFHGLERQGITDFEGEFSQAAGHKSLKIRDTYDVKPEKVPPTVIFLGKVLGIFSETFGGALYLIVFTGGQRQNQTADTEVPHD